MKIYSMTSKDAGKKPYGKKITTYILYVKDSGQDLTDIDQQNFSVSYGSFFAARRKFLSVRCVPRAAAEF